MRFCKTTLWIKNSPNGIKDMTFTTSCILATGCGTILLGKEGLRRRSRGQRRSGQAAATSVLAKSLPTNSSGSPVALARA